MALLWIEDKHHPSIAHNRRALELLAVTGDPIGKNLWEASILPVRAQVHLYSPCGRPKSRVG